MDFKNIIWFLVDSVRNYYTDLDERGRLEVMDELAIDAVNFETAITSAPSTIMSVSSMMTGVGAMYQSRDYRTFKYNKSKLKSFPLILKDNGYTIYSLIFFPEGRRFLKQMFSNICENNWQSIYSGNEFWSNDQMNEILKDILSDNLKEPFFLYVHYNCRNDPGTNNKIEKGLDMIKKAGYFNDSVIILNSDHGYPDKSRNISFYNKRKYGHDLVMTDDNILTPQIIKFPGIGPKHIKNPISTLDIVPTILDYLDLNNSLDFKNFYISGKSRLPLIYGNDDSNTDIVRVDNRFIFQNNKVVALRDNSFKYIYYYETGKQEFFDLAKDIEEENNLIDSIEYNTEITRFTEKLKEQEDALIKFHVNVLTTKTSNYDIKSNIIIIGKTNREFELVFNEVFSNLGYKKINGFGGGKLDIVLKKLKSRISVLLYNNQNKENGNTAFFFPISDDPVTNYEIANYYKLFKTNFTKHKYVVDSNLDIATLPKHWIFIVFRNFKKKLPLLRSQPKTVFLDIFIWSKRILLGFK